MQESFLWSGGRFFCVNAPPGIGGLLEDLFPVGGGGDPVLLLEDLDQGFRLLVSAGIGDRCHGKLGGFQKVLSLGQAELLDIP